MNWFKKLLGKHSESTRVSPSSFTVDNIRSIHVYTTEPVVTLANPRATMATPVVLSAYKEYFRPTLAVLRAIESREIPIEYHAVSVGDLEDAVERAVKVLRPTGRPIVAGEDFLQVIVVLKE